MLQSSPFIGCRLCEGRDMQIVMHHGCSPVAPSRHKHAWSTEIWAVFNGYYEMRVPGRKFWFGFWSKLAGQVRVWTLLRYFNPEAGPSQVPTHIHRTEKPEATLTWRWWCIARCDSIRMEGQVWVPTHHGAPALCTLSGVERRGSW